MDNNFKDLVKIPDSSAVKNFEQTMRSPEMQNYMAQQAQQQIMQNIVQPIAEVEFRNPNEKTEQLLEENNKTNHAIHYNEMKANAQLYTLLKVDDTQNDELERLESVNQELQKVNRILEEERKNSTRNTVIITIVTGILLLGIEHWRDIYNFILSLIK